jgi:hypothetical protein
VKEEEPEIVRKVLYQIYFGYYHDDDEACFQELHQTISPACTTYDSVVEGTKLSFQTDAARGRDASVQIQIHIQVYKLADMLGVDLLRAVATAKVMESFMRSLNKDTLLCTLETVLNHT